MKLPKFLQKRTPPHVDTPEDTHEVGDWTIFTAENHETGESAIFRTRLSKPDRPDIAELSTAIVIKWPYMPPDQLPPADVNSAQLEFEEALDPLASSPDSEIVHVSTGMGLKEWIFYAKDRHEFMTNLNHLLASHPRYPLTIEFFDDPGWEVWDDMVAPIKRRTQN